jgi:hypothetical protein
MIDAGGHVQVNLWQVPMPPISVAVEGPYCDCHDAEMVFDEHDGGFRCAAQQEVGDDSSPLEAAHQDFKPAWTTGRYLTLGLTMRAMALPLQTVICGLTTGPGELGCRPLGWRRPAIGRPNLTARSAGRHGQRGAGMSRSGVFSTCGSTATRCRAPGTSDAPRLVVIGLNPSTADETKLDPTLRRVRNFAQRDGLRRLRHAQPVRVQGDGAARHEGRRGAGRPDERPYLERLATNRVNILCAWGTTAATATATARSWRSWPNERYGVEADTACASPGGLPLSTRSTSQEASPMPYVCR